jgi:rod shape determining protein RodA
MASRRGITDWPLVVIALVLSAFGIAMIYSAGQTEVRTPVAGFWLLQLRWLLVGLMAAYLVSRLSLQLIEWATPPVYVASLLVLVVLLFIGSGAGTASGTKSWLTLGGIRLGQPSELAKITTVLMLAKVLSARREAPTTLRELWRPALIIAVPWALIIAQHDLGTSMVLIGIFFGMLYWADVPWPLLVFVASPAVSLILAFSTGLWGAWFLLLLALVIRVRPYALESVAVIAANVAMGVVAPMLWDKLADYQKSRLISFLDPQADPRNTGYHVLQSQVAIGSGGWFGKGFTLGTQKRLAFLPEQETDFIFPVIGEELGFLGVTLALALLLLLLLRTVRIATRSTDPFTGLVAFGFATAWFVHVVVNVGMTVGLMPITGIPLPFFSYGGSFMLASWLAVGILVRISAAGRGQADMLAF